MNCCARSRSRSRPPTTFSSTYGSLKAGSMMRSSWPTPGALAPWSSSVRSSRAGGDADTAEAADAELGAIYDRLLTRDASVTAALRRQLDERASRLEARLERLDLVAAVSTRRQVTERLPIVTASEVQVLYHVADGQIGLFVRQGDETHVPCRRRRSERGRGRRCGVPLGRASRRRCSWEAGRRPCPTDVGRRRAPSATGRPPPRPGRRAPRRRRPPRRGAPPEPPRRPVPCALRRRTVRPGSRRGDRHAEPHDPRQPTRRPGRTDAARRIRRTANCLVSTPSSMRCRRSFPTPSSFATPTATVAAVTASMRGAGCVHLASHGIFRQNAPMASGIRLCRRMAHRPTDRRAGSDRRHDRAQRVRHRPQRRPCRRRTARLAARLPPRRRPRGRDDALVGGRRGRRDHHPSSSTGPTTPGSESRRPPGGVDDHSPPPSAPVVVGAVLRRRAVDVRCIPHRLLTHGCDHERYVAQPSLPRLHHRRDRRARSAGPRVPTGNGRRPGRAGRNPASSSSSSSRRPTPTSSTWRSAASGHPSAWCRRATCGCSASTRATDPVDGTK